MKSCSVSAASNNVVRATSPNHSQGPGLLMDKLDRTIINELQGGFPICERPFTGIAEQIGISEEQLIERIDRLTHDGILSRFGPLYNIERMGGHYSLCAMKVPEDDLPRVTDTINHYDEVAHNYERLHEFNVWFVLAVETETQKQHILEKIEKNTGYPVYDMPKINEYYVGLKFDA
jgi:DNA-binding Lrp family transcriptional regulator